jgi:hypothetical protein
VPATAAAAAAAAAAGASSHLQLFTHGCIVQCCLAILVLQARGQQQQRSSTCHTQLYESNCTNGLCVWLHSAVRFGHLSPARKQPAAKSAQHVTQSLACNMVRGLCVNPLLNKRLAMCCAGDVPGRLNREMDKDVCNNVAGGKLCTTHSAIPHPSDVTDSYSLQLSSRQLSSGCCKSCAPAAFKTFDAIHAQDGERPACKINLSL